MNNVSANFTQIYDKLVNLVAGVNNKRDKSTYNTHVAIQLNDQELLSMYRDIWIAGKAVDIFAEDMTRKWRAYSGPKDEIGKFIAEENRLRLKNKVYDSVKWARLYGGSVIIPIFKSETNHDLRKPLVPEKVKAGSLERFLVVDKTNINPVGKIELDPLAENFYQPNFYSMAGNVNEIHYSRIFKFDGVDLPYQAKQNNSYWGDSVLQRMYQTINDADTTFHSVALMMLEMVTDVIKIPNLSSLLTKDVETSALIERFNLMKLLSSISQLKILDAEEQWERHQIQLPGTNDIITQFLTMVSASASIPVTRFIGTSPRGMNATGESDLEIHYENVHSKQENDLDPILFGIDKIIQMSIFGSLIDGFKYEFLPLYMQDAKEAADTQKTKADERKVYTDMNVLPMSSVAAKLVDEGWDISTEHMKKLEDYDKSLDLKKEMEVKRNIFGNNSNQNRSTPTPDKSIE